MPGGCCVYFGSVGTGFSDAELARLAALLRERAVNTSPFTPAPKPPERPHWVQPELRARVKFTEVTKDGMLRHPVYLGLEEQQPPGVGGSAPQGAPPGRAAPGRKLPSGPKAPPKTGSTKSRAGSPPDVASAPLDLVCQQLELLESARRDGRIALPGGGALDVTNLAKVFWPTQQFTKGDLLRYYARVSPLILPAVADRPLVMKRYPNGVSGKAFYQHRAPDDPPATLRVAIADGDEERVPRIIGGSLLALLYMTQLASISQDPWFSTIEAPHVAREAALDLDPMPGVPFSQVRDVARAIRDVLEALDIPACAKTSGSSGLHIYVPLADGTSYEAGQTFCKIIATVVATQYPRVATVERKVGARGRTVYIDYLQNIEGKTLATAYAVRANDFAGVSTPLRWDELDSADLHPEEFTLATAEGRFAEVGDLWAPISAGPRLDLREALERMGRLVG